MTSISHYNEDGAGSYGYVHDVPEVRRAATPARQSMKAWLLASVIFLAPQPSASATLSASLRGAGSEQELQPVVVMWPPEPPPPPPQRAAGPAPSSSIGPAPAPALWTSPAPSPALSPAPAPAVAPSPEPAMAVMAPPSTEDTMSDSKRFHLMFSGISVYLFLVLVSAVVYYSWRDPKYPRPGIHIRRQFKFGLCNCFEEPRLLLFALCCPMVRWADTLDKGNDHGSLLPFWHAFTSLFSLLFAYLFITLVIAWPFVGSAAFFAIVAIEVFYRQRLRQRFSIPAFTPRILMMDTITWLFCPCCAIVQEAREVESACVPMADVPSSGAQ